MPRHILPEERIHPAIRAKVEGNHREIVDEVLAATAKHRVVVVGMAQNPHPKQACKLLRAKGIDFQYLEYGSYLKDWRRRNALKMWTGWPTFPMVFVDGTLVVGSSDLDALVKNGELERTLAAPRR